MEEILIIDDSPQICAMLAEYVLPELGYRAAVAGTGQQGLARLRQRLPDLILLDLQLPDTSGLELLRTIAREGFDVPVILMTAHGSESIAVEAFRIGARNYLIKPFSEVEAQTVIDQALRERRLAREKETLTRRLQQRVQELTVIYSIGKSVSTLLDHDELLERIVEAAVYITHAEEGFLLLRDPQTDELYLRSAKNLGELRAQRLRMPIDDSLAGQVFRTGKPVRLDRASYGGALKIKTGFLVRAILQVPLVLGKQIIGVLAVDNQQSDRTFSENDQYLLSALADYAAIALENARLYDQVKRSEERYRDLFANANDMILTLDRDLQLVNVNKVGERLLGQSQEQLAGRSLQSLCSPETWARVAPVLTGLSESTMLPPFELELLRSGGERVYVELSVRAIMSNDRITGLHAIGRDLTERRRLEEQLIQAEKLSALGQLVAGVAHELNNPLTSISGYTQLMLRESNLDTTMHHDLTQINAQAERAARIVQNLLTFAREHKPERLPVNMNEVLRNTLSLRNYQLRVDNVRVVWDLDQALPVTIADPFQLQQVFLNLINNAHQAIVARGSGGGTLTLRTRAIHKAGGDGKVEASESLNTAAPNMLQIEVADTGVGISEQNLSRIFDPFFTTKPVGQGTGLGLSICFGIVQEHSGRIWASSEAGVGTSVFVELPLHAHVASRDPSGMPRTAARARSLVSYAVLVVDDEEPVGQLLSRLLTQLGQRATVVTSGEEALTAIAATNFDLILSDIKMPGMSGFELYRAIVERDADLARRIVFVTGDTLTPATQARIAQIGNPYIAKPFQIDRLEELVRSLLERRMLEQPPQVPLRG